MTTPVVVPASPMSLGDVFSSSLTILRRRFGRLVRISLVQQLVTLLFAAPMGLYFVLAVLPQVNLSRQVFTSSYLTSVAIGSGIGAVFGLVSIVVSVYFLGLLVHTSHEAMLGKNPTLAELRALNRGTMRRLGPVYAVATIAYEIVLGLGMLPMFSLLPSLLTGASMGGSSAASDAFLTKFLAVWSVGMLTALVLGVAYAIVVVKFAYINQVGAIERQGLMAAVKRAAALTKGSFWRTAGYLIVMSLAVGMVQQVVGMVAEIGLLPVMLNVDPRHPEAIFTSGAFWGMYGLMVLLLLILQAVLRPFQVAFTTVMYVDQVRRIAIGPLPRPVPGQYGWQQPGPAV